MTQTEIELLRKTDLGEASTLLGRAFSTQPSSLAIYPGAEASVVAERLKHVFGAMLGRLPGESYVAKQDGRIVGVMRMVEWPQCQMSAGQRLKILPILIRSGGGFSAMRRSLEFRGTWTKADPQQPHWHLDPLGVLPETQGQGIGGRLMLHYCHLVDRTGKAAYHETDRPKNVAFYERFGFEVIGEEIILGFNSWYMWRPAATGTLRDTPEG
jgi:ribosomal protein S18 acetylase RimI-like enzyme